MGDTLGEGRGGGGGGGHLNRGGGGHPDCNIPLGIDTPKTNIPQLLSLFTL